MRTLWDWTPWARARRRAILAAAELQQRREQRWARERILRAANTLAESRWERPIRGNQPWR